MTGNVAFFFHYIFHKNFPQPAIPRSPAFRRKIKDEKLQFRGCGQ